MDGFKKQPLSISLAAALVLALIGPFGTYGTRDFWTLLAMWVTLNLSVHTVIYVIYSALKAIWPDHEPVFFRELFLIFGSVLGGSVIFVIVTYVFGTSPSEPYRWFVVTSYMAALLVVLIASRHYIALTRSPGLAANARAELAAGSAVVQSRLADRLGLPPDANILKVSADGHFIEVKTCSKILRTRMRFSDAVAQLDGLDGVTLHRSHWVALKAICGWVPDKMKPQVVLHDGTHVPVSKTYRNLVESMDLLVITGLPEDVS